MWIFHTLSLSSPPPPSVSLFLSLSLCVCVGLCLCVCVIIWAPTAAVNVVYSNEFEIVLLCFYVPAIAACSYIFYLFFKRSLFLPWNNNNKKGNCNFLRIFLRFASLYPAIRTL